MKLIDAAPELVADLESPLAHLGRGDLIAQLRVATLKSWKYDEFANTTLLELSGTDSAEIFSLYDEAGVNLELDHQGVVCRIEVLEGEHLAKRLRDDAR